jgi:hypothetical protein
MTFGIVLLADSYHTAATRACSNIHSIGSSTELPF